MKKFIACFLFISTLLLSSCEKKRSVDFKNTDFNSQVKISSYLRKNDLVAKYSFKKRTVYTLGTCHWNHFYRNTGYSLHDIQNVIENLKPDSVYIESREDTFSRFGVLDGPIDMIFIYSYCLDHNIPVKFIDYWQIDNDYLKNQNSTSEERDNRIFNNIFAKLQDEPNNSTILVCFGSAHFFNQKPRMEYAGFKKEYLSYNESLSFFDTVTEDFKYPVSMDRVLSDCIEYTKHGYIDVINQNITDEEVRMKVLEDVPGLSDTYEFYRRMIQYGEEFFGE